MKSTKIRVAMLLASGLAFVSIRMAPGESRILEFPFALSADPLSECSASFTLVSSGRLEVAIALSPQPASPPGAQLTVTIVRPDGSEAARKQVSLSSRLEYRTTEQELDRFVAVRKTTWTVRLLGSGEGPRRELKGVIRVTVPATPRVLLDSQFTLLASGNAQEIPFLVPAPGKLQIDTDWESIPGSDGPATHVALIISLIHPGTSRVHARRQNRSPQRIEHRVTADELDAGARWTIRIQNNSQSKVAGKFQATLAPVF